mmetsp:Transcript_26687/g.44751  ORF Transcript_26687/g.44751 Transcript_26687/m.44751 type:complete len:222 (+) Transcript_26687:88-753(+)
MGPRGKLPGTNFCIDSDRRFITRRAKGDSPWCMVVMRNEWRGNTTLDPLEILVLLLLTSECLLPRASKHCLHGVSIGMVLFEALDHSVFVDDENRHRAGYHPRRAVDNPFASVTVIQDHAVAARCRVKLRCCPPLPILQLGQQGRKECVQFLVTCVNSEQLVGYPSCGVVNCHGVSVILADHGHDSLLGMLLRVEPTRAKHSHEAHHGGHRTGLNGASIGR